MPIRLLAGACTALLVAACANAPVSQPPASNAPAPLAALALPEPAIATVPEAWESARSPADELDSLATWTAPDGDTWLMASAKSGDQVLVYDAGTGRELRRIGATGTGAGQFDRPN